MRPLYFLSILFLTSTGAIFAQDFDQRLLAGFTVEEVQTMVNEDPKELAVMTAFARQGFEFTDYPKEKKGALDPSTALTIADKATFNPLAFDLKPHDHARFYYPIAGEPTKMVVILPRTELTSIIKASSK
jgi:hypothetical protein